MPPLITIVPTRFTVNPSQQIVPDGWQAVCDDCGFKSRTSTTKSLAKALGRKHLRESHPQAVSVPLDRLIIQPGEVSGQGYPRQDEFSPIRPTRELMLMNIAVEVSRRSTCQRAQVGAVIGREGRVLSMGYNGAPPGMPHCQHTSDPFTTMVDQMFGGCKLAIHAELNAIAWAARAGVSVEGAEIYCTHQPCRACGQAIVSAGITTVWFANNYHTAYEFPESVKVGKLVPST